MRTIVVEVRGDEKHGGWRVTVRVGRWLAFERHATTLLQLRPALDAAAAARFKALSREAAASYGPRANRHAGPRLGGKTAY